LPEAMLRGWNATLDTEGVLRKVSGKSMAWDAGVLLQVPDPQCFEVSLGFAAARVQFILGITQASYTGPGRDMNDLSRPFIEKNPPKCFVECSKATGKVHPCLVEDGVVKTGPAEAFGPLTAQVRMRYEHGCLTFTSGEHQSQPHKVPVGSYYPCVFLVEKELSLKVQLGRKRRCPDELNERLWKDRKFTDASLSCGGRSIPVHRAVLAAASPVFERMWECGMREAASTVAEIDDTTPAALEAMVQFAYTVSLPEEADLGPLFQLAGKYEVEGLAEVVGQRMLAELGPGNASEWLCTVLEHADAGDQRAIALWQALYSRLLQQPTLQQEVLESLLRARCASLRAKLP